jgi:hypothetical protein
MTRPRLNVRLSCIVLAAVVGLLSVTTEAAAAGNSCPCCAGRDCSMECCRQPGTRSGPEADVPPVAVTPEHDRSTMLPVVPCECRSDEPAEPAFEPETPTSDRDHAQLVCLPFEASRPVTIASVSAPAFGLSRAPLLLNTTRLLI